LICALYRLQGEGEQPIFDGGGFNRWMQHTKDCASSGSVADETAPPDLLQREAESADVGTLAKGRISPEDRPVF
jgi:hypothetical protein